LVRRRTGGDVAMIAADELESLVETAHLLRSEKNAQRLLTALSRARAKNIAPTTMAHLNKLVDLWKYNRNDRNLYIKNTNNLAEKIIISPISIYETISSEK
jgi:hypothetical protein